jgi:hypothetical protein
VEVRVRPTQLLMFSSAEDQVKAGVTPPAWAEASEAP